MAYSDIQNKVGQIQMANRILLAQGTSDDQEMSDEEKNELKRKLKKQVRKTPKQRQAEARKKDPKFQGGSPGTVFVPPDGPTTDQDIQDALQDEDMEQGDYLEDPEQPFNINSLLQIGGAIGGGIVPLLQQLLIRNPNAMASGFPYDFEGGVVTPRYFTPPRYRQQPFLHIRTKDITDEELFHFNNFIKSMGGGLDTVRRHTPLSIAGLPHSPPVELLPIKDDKGNLIPSPLRFKTDAERIRLMEDFAKYDRPRA